MRTRTLAFTLALSALALAGCKSAQQPDDPYLAHYTTTPPPGAVVLPAAPPAASPPETARPPLATPTHLPD